MKFVSLLLLSALSLSTAQASLVAVIDSGVDVNHTDLKQQIWTNPLDVNGNRIDEDKNGFVDDFYGWNFVSNDNKVIDMRYAAKFNDDVAKFFELQYLLYLYNKGQNAFSQEFIDWYYNTMFPNGKPNQQILELGEFFGGYSHGTHVAGIVAKKNPELKILSVKLMGTKAHLTFRNTEEQATQAAPAGELISEEDMNSIKGQLDQAAEQNTAKFADISRYISGHGARVANASFGTGFPMTMQWLTQALAGVDQGQIEELAIYFQNKLVELNTKTFGAARNTLYVVAAGNDGIDIDQYPDSPASVKTDNIISVAATWERNQIADFSCFGTGSVHVAAPGVGILSSAPGNNHVYMNGTSQAAPYVARVAGLVVDANPNLTPAQVREILMGTVDFKEWLVGKVASAGIVNEERAVTAALYTSVEGLSIADAIEVAKSEVADEPEAVFAKSLVDGPIFNGEMKMFVTPRPNPIQFE